MEQKTETQVGDFVRLTDPIDNGKIVRVEMVENGWIEFIGGGQSCYEQVKGSIKLCGVEHFWTLSEFIRLLEQGFGVKLYPESAVNLYRHAAEKNAEELGKSEKYWEDEHNKLLDAQDYIKKVCAESSADIQKLDTENKKLKEELARCRAKNSDYLREKKQAEDKAEAIQHCKDFANIQSHTCISEQRKCSAEYQQLATWLQKLADYEDKTYIEAEWLVKNGFEKREYDYLYCDDVEEISAQCIDAEMGVWRVEVGFLDHCENTESLNICTVGELRMFLAIEGLESIAQQFK